MAPEFLTAALEQSRHSMKRHHRFEPAACSRGTSVDGAGAARGLIACGLFGALSLVAACNAGNEHGPVFERIAPSGLADSQKLWNYSQVIAAKPGARFIEVAGTTGDDQEGNIVPPGTFEAQVQRTFANLEVSLRAAGASGHDVVRVRIYVVGLDGQRHWPVINAAMRKHFGDQGPTSTLVGVQALAAPEILFEIDATAAVSAK
jgi:enamine deaminase RidA (YjgF/YER057c/UK114 family)